MAGLREFQLTNQIGRANLQSSNHFFNIARKNPVYAKTIIDWIYKENWGNTIATSLTDVSTMEVEDKVFKWKRGVDSYPFATMRASWVDPAGNVSLETVERPLENGSTGYIDLEDCMFGINMRIGRQDTFMVYQLWLQDDGQQISSNVKRYRVQLIAPEGVCLPHEDLVVGGQWFFMGGLSEDDYSQDGSSFDYALTTFDMQSEVTQFRFKKQFSYDFYVASKKALKENEAQLFYYIDPDTKKKVGTWLDATTAQFLQMIKSAEDLTLKFGTSNRNLDGSINNRGINGQIATSTAGIEQYYLHNNLQLYDPFTFSMRNFIQRYIQENLGKQNVANTRLVLSSGTSGYLMLQEAIRREYGLSNYNFMQNNQNPAYTWNTADASVFIRNAQIEGVKDSLGIEVRLVRDATKDNTLMYTKTYSDGTLMKAYEIDVMLTSPVEGFQGGKTSMVNNIQKVKVTGYDPIFGVQAGMGFDWGGASKPVAGISGFSINSPVTMSTIHYMWTGGIVVWKPELLKRLAPIGLYS